MYKSPCPCGTPPQRKLLISEKVELTSSSVKVRRNISFSPLARQFIFALSILPENTHFVPVASIAEQEKQPWGQAMFDQLLAMVKAADQWRDRGAKEIPKEERERWIVQYFAILASGFATPRLPAPICRGAFR